jgi:hypothetical protein
MFLAEVARGTGETVPELILSTDKGRLPATESSRCDSRAPSDVLAPVDISPCNFAGAVRRRLTLARRPAPSFRAASWPLPFW